MLITLHSISIGRVFGARSNISFVLRPKSDIWLNYLVSAELCLFGAAARSPRLPYGGSCLRDVAPPPWSLLPLCSCRAPSRSGPERRGTLRINGCITTRLKCLSRHSAAAITRWTPASGCPWCPREECIFIRSQRC